MFSSYQVLRSGEPVPPKATHRPGHVTPKATHPLADLCRLLTLEVQWGFELPAPDPMAWCSKRLCCDSTYIRTNQNATNMYIFLCFVKLFTRLWKSKKGQNETSFISNLFKPDWRFLWPFGWSYQISFIHTYWSVCLYLLYLIIILKAILERHTEPWKKCCHQCPLCYWQTETAH